MLRNMRLKCVLKSQRGCFDCFVPRRGNASPEAQENKRSIYGYLVWDIFCCWWLLLGRAYLSIHWTCRELRVHTALQFQLISMEIFAVLEVLFVFSSGPLSSAPFSISFFRQHFFILFSVNFPTLLSCPSFYLLSVSSHFLPICLFVSCPGLLSSSFCPLTLIFHLSLSTLSSAQSPSLLLSLFTVPSLPWCRSLSAAAASLVSWNTADLSTEEPEIQVWCKRHLKT